MLGFLFGLGRSGSANTSRLPSFPCVDGPLRACHTTSWRSCLPLIKRRDYELVPFMGKSTRASSKMGRSTRATRTERPSLFQVSPFNFLPSVNVNNFYAKVLYLFKLIVSCRGFVTKKKHDIVLLSIIFSVTYLS